MERIHLETKITTDDTGAIEGIAWPFGTPDRVGDVIVKGAFSGAATPMPMLFGHDQGDPVGVWEAAEEREEGLHMKGRLLVDDVPRARQVRALVASGAVRGLSIGFVTKNARRLSKGREINRLELLEVSLVSIPSHPGARVTSAKSAVTAIRLTELINSAETNLRG